MSVYYKFKSAKEYCSIPMDGYCISVWDLKAKIYESKHLGRGTDFDLIISNAETNEEYADEKMLIPKDTSVLVRRIPGLPCKPIVVERDDSKATELKAKEIPERNASTVKSPEESEWDEFVKELHAIPEVLLAESGNPVQEAPSLDKDEEDRRIKALVNTPALDWQLQSQDAFGPGRGFGRSMGGQIMPGRGFGRGGILERKTPPQGYICHRCKVPGHFIQHCPTNGDPNFDVRKLRPPTGIPKSMLMATPDGPYALPSGGVAVLKPNEAAFEKEIEGLPSAQLPVADLPPELHCPMCKEVMKDAVLSSKCCFRSFCDKCIRDRIISKSMCACGATNILADDLVPNKTLRQTINRILESTTSSAENADTESAHPRLKVPSYILYSAVKEEEHTLLLCKDNNPITQVPVKEEKVDVNLAEQSVDKSRATKNMDQSKATLESASVKEATSHQNAPQAEKEGQQKLPSEEGEKKKKKKTLPPANALDLQWETLQDPFVMPFDTSAYNPYLGGMLWGIDGYMMPYAGPLPHYMGYTPGVFEAPFSDILPQDPFTGQWYTMPPLIPEREPSKNRECCRKVISGADDSSLKSKSKGNYVLLLSISQFSQFSLSLSLSSSSSPITREMRS